MPNNMSGAAITGAFIMTSVGAFYLLSNKWTAHARIFVKTGVIARLHLQRAPDFSHRRSPRQNGNRATTRDTSGDGRIVSRQTQAPLVIIGQPNDQQGKIDNPLQVPGMLSMLTYKRWSAHVRGLDAFPRQDWPGNIPLLYYSYHINGWPWHFLHRHHGCCLVTALERQTF